MPANTLSIEANRSPTGLITVNEGQYPPMVYLKTSNRLFRFVDTGEVVLRPYPSASTATHEPSDFMEAMLDLHSVKWMAEEEDDVEPSNDTIERAQRVLERLYRTFPRPYAVYPMMDGDVAVEAHTKPGTDVTVICDSDGSYRCLSYIDDEFNRVRFDRLDEMLSPSVIDAFIITSPDSYIQSLW